MQGPWAVCVCHSSACGCLLVPKVLCPPHRRSGRRVMPVFPPSVPSADVTREALRLFQVGLFVHQISDVPARQDENDGEEVRSSVQVAILRVDLVGTDVLLPPPPWLEHCIVPLRRRRLCSPSPCHLFYSLLLILISSCFVLASLLWL